MRRILTSTLLAATLAAGGVVASANAAIVNLGFAFDESGSVGSSGFELQRDGLAAAIRNIPVTGGTQYRVGVVAFDSGVRTVISPTVLTDAAVREALATALEGTGGFNGGGTSYDGAFDQIVSDFAGAGATMAETSLINITTDGLSGSPAGDLASRNAALAAGWDSVSAECINLCSSATATATTRLLDLVSPNPGVYVPDGGTLTNPLVQGFVLEVADFAGYAAAIDSKVQQIIISQVPLPAGLALMLGGLMVLGGIGAQRRRTIAA